MNESSLQTQNSTPLEKFVETAREQLRQLGYGRKSLCRYTTTWKYFVNYARQKHLGNTYSEETAARFIAERLDLPTVRVPRDSTIPSVWDNALIDKLLAVVDRSSSRGKRDYAIFLLACRLGLRLGDIKAMTLDNLNWDERKIEILQSKTEVPLCLPLTEEVGEALIDYLKTGRPKTTHRVLFLKMNFPFEPFAKENHLHYIVAYWRTMVGIQFHAKHRCGLHSLRHSLATRLLREETPFNIISEFWVTPP